MVRAMLEDARNELSLIPITFDVQKLWGEATSTAIYIKNRLPHAALSKQEAITPYEALMGQKPSISHLQPFGALCYTPYSKRTSTK